MAVKVLPWPARHERKARVERARQRADAAEAETAASQRKTAETRPLVEDLHEMRRHNHVSELLDYIIQQPQRSGGEQQH